MVSKKEKEFLERRYKLYIKCINDKIRELKKEVKEGNWTGALVDAQSLVRLIAWLSEIDFFIIQNNIKLDLERK